MEIHWRQGLFLQPHHLQRMQRELHHLVRAEREQFFSYPYGIIKAQVSAAELKRGTVHFDRLHAILRNGVEVRFPEAAVLSPLPIGPLLEKNSGGLGIHLGLPKWLDGQANTTRQRPESKADASTIYTIEEIKYADENTGRDERPVEVRKLSARLLVEGVDDFRGFETLPLLRVVHDAGAAAAGGESEPGGLPIEDPKFAPPCLLLQGSAILQTLVRNLVNLVQAHRQDLAERLARSAINFDNLRGVHLQQFFRLRILNRFSARLPSLIEAPAVTPFDVDRELRELLGELAALHPERDAFASAPYQHDHPYPGFAELARKIEPLLPGHLPPGFRKIKFRRIDGVLTAPLIKEDGSLMSELDCSLPDDYFLGITCQADADELKACVENADRFKLMPPSLRTKAFRGVVLEGERSPPALPAGLHLHYFRLDRRSNESARLWGLMVKEHAIVIPSLSDDFKWGDDSFALYLSIPSVSTPP